ncbi:MAG: glycosyltransferase [Deltaproteobacteria bacterium]|nr:glycosyltransferase [Deltaproteobacteria bacterium]
MRRVVVVPCFNEARRLDAGALLQIVDDDTGLLLIDDGSSDDTLALLRSLASGDPRRVEVLALAHNSGKGEAVRHGLQHAERAGAVVVAYLDADLSTPVSEMQRILALLDERSDAQVALGSRVALLGADIERKSSRHYLGRVFATVASKGLGLRVYDTQCGAKAFRASEPLRRALAQPFTSRWAFDVELLSRLLEDLPPRAFFEVPLQRWSDVAGSKLQPLAMVKAGVDVVRISLRRRRRR